MSEKEEIINSTVKKKSTLKSVLRGLSFFVLLIIYAFLAGSLSMFFLMLVRNIFFGEDKNLMMSFAAGAAGILVASPLLLIIFLPWFAAYKGDRSLLAWAIVPTISASLYCYLISFGYLKIENMLLFTGSGFFTSFFMWLTYGRSSNLIKANKNVNN